MQDQSKQKNTKRKETHLSWTKTFHRRKRIFTTVQAGSEAVLSLEIKGSPKFFSVLMLNTWTVHVDMCLQDQLPNPARLRLEEMQLEEELELSVALSGNEMLILVATSQPL